MAKSNKNYTKKINGSRNTNNKRDRHSRNFERSTNDINSAASGQRQDVDRGVGFNDPSWYGFDPRLDDSVYNFPTTSFIGVGTKMGEYPRSGGDLKYYYHSPSIMVIRTNPSIGYIGAEGDTFFNIQNAPINMAMLRLYNELSSINAKTTNYQPQDLAMAILAVGEVLSISQYIKRTLTIPYISNPRNRTFPRTATAACGVNYDDLKSNLASYRVRYNTIMAAANAILMFDNFNWFKKCANMYRHIIADSESGLAQTYFISPYSTWIIDESSDEQGTKLTTAHVPFGEETTLADHLDLLDRMVRALLNSSTLNYVYADIKNYVTKRGGNLVSFDLMSEDDRTEITLPSMSKDFHIQLMNATVMGAPMSAEDIHTDLPEQENNVTPDNDVLPSVQFNSVQYAPAWKHDDVFFSEFRPILNYMDEPDSADRMESIRLQSVPTQYLLVPDYKLGYAVQASLTDHYIVSISILDITMDKIGPQYVVGTQPMLRYVNGENDALVAHDMALLSQFDYAPLMYIADLPSTQESVTESNMHILGDVNWYTTLPDDTRDSILYTSFLGLFKF